MNLFNMPSAGRPSAVGEPMETRSLINSTDAPIRGGRLNHLYPLIFAIFLTIEEIMWHS
jgi:hypothetical protein